MRLSENEQILAFYRDLGKIYAQGSPEALGWGSAESQRKRFEVLSTIGLVDGDSILDCGCGFGDLYDFLGKPSGYTGIDLNPASVSFASNRFPKADFRVVDLLEHEEEYDWILCSGIFCLDFGTGIEYFSKALERLFGLCRRGIGFNMLSSYKTDKFEDMLYVEPSAAIAIVATETYRFSLIHGYLPHDFTMFAYR